MVRHPAFGRAVTVFVVSGIVAATVAGKPAKSARLLPAGAVDVTRLLPDPPAAGSAEARAELDAVLAVQSARTPADVARAKAEEKFTVFAFADVVGPSFDAKRCPRTADLFASLEAEAKAACKDGKAHWNRRRPPFVDDRIKPVVTLEDEGSYPSSHSARGQLYAEVLAAVLPAGLREPLLARGRQIGFDRVVGGVHYPSDVTAARTVGHAIAALVLADPAAQPLLAAVRTELAAQGPATSVRP